MFIVLNAPVRGRYCAPMHNSLLLFCTRCWIQMLISCIAASRVSSLLRCACRGGVSLRGDDLLGIYADAIREQIQAMSTCACRMMNISGSLLCLSLSRLS